jgi:predicted anti-sigma-YlaC factor YlaD
MNHEQFRELVNLYIDGALDDTQSAEIFSHLSTCIDCRNLMRSSLQVRSYYQNMELEETPASLDHRVLANASMKSKKSIRHNILIPLWYTRISLPLPAAASIAILILIGSLLFSPLLFEKPKQLHDNEIELFSKMPPEFQQQMQFFR